MRTEGCNLIVLGKRERELQDEFQEKTLRRKPGFSLGEPDESDPDAGRLEDVEYVNLERTVQGVDEKRVRELMRELMEEIGMVQPAVNLRKTGNHLQRIAAACDLPVCTASFNCDSASASTNCASMARGTCTSSTEYSGDRVLEGTDIPSFGNVDPATVFHDRRRRARRVIVKDHVDASALGGLDERGASTSDEYYFRVSNMPCHNSNCLQNVFSEDDICFRSDDDGVQLQMSPWEEEAKSWCFSREGDGIGDWILTTPI